MAKMLWKYTNGFDPTEFVSVVYVEDNKTLADEEKDLFIIITHPFLAPSETVSVTLNFDNNQCAFIVNGTTGTLYINDTEETLSAGAMGFYYAVHGSGMLIPIKTDSGK